VGAFTIGTLARAAGVTVETVRYYERRGLLQQPARGDGYRQYSDDDVDRLQFVRRAKALGFTLAEIRTLLDASTTGSAPDVLAAARAKLDRVDADVRRLRQTRDRLARLVQVCADGSEDCVALEIDTH
jgi:DNA-binding transcriptional MerR regulator